MSRIFLGIIALFMVGCAYRTDYNEVDDMGDRCIAAKLAEMTRTAAAGNAVAGLPVGVQISGLQESQLEPGEYTIQFTAIPPADGEGFAAFAIVNWKVAGQQVTRIVSVFSGAAISGVAEAVDVSIVDVSQIGSAGFPTTPLPYKIGTSLSRGGRADTMQPATLSTQLTALSVAHGASQVFLIPKDCGITSVMVLAAGSPVPVSSNAIVASQESPATAINVWYPVLQGPGWVPIQSGAVDVRVVNNDAANAIFVNVIWGIEG